MAFQPSTTVYLCTGTGMDASNSIWWHKYAYSHTNQGDTDDSWWNTCFQFFKAHSIAEGHWYCTYLDPSRGFFKVGRMPLNDNSIPMGESGLGSGTKQSQINNPDIPFAECIRAVDYIVFANDAEGFSGDIQYAFVDRIDSINHNVASVYFTIDAIMTYQKFFHLGRSMVIRDMQFQERDGSENGKPVLENLNKIAENIAPGTSDYVQESVNCPEEEYKFTNLGQYRTLLTMSDIDLNSEKVVPNPYFGGIASFSSSRATNVGLCNLGVGVYHLPNDKQCEALNRLGSFDAMEHLLYTYVVPANLVDPLVSGEPVFIQDTINYQNADYCRGNYIIKIPKQFSSIGAVEAGQTASEGYTPLNLKLYTAPYSYYSISDQQGSSIEILPQLFYANANDDDEFYFTLPIYLQLEIAPNVASALYVAEYMGPETLYDPLTTLWQMPSYAMTPNASGYNNQLITAIAYKNVAPKQMSTGSGWNFLSTLAIGATSLVGGAIGFTFGGPGGAAAGSTAGGVLGNAIWSPSKQTAGSDVGSAASLENQAQLLEENANLGRQFGLPKAVGGIGSGFTSMWMQNPGYRIFRMHLNNQLMQQLDMYFSLYGYAQNSWRYPHINIRKRWCYVKLGNVNIVPQQANAYDMGGVPYFARLQIEQRLQSGITFWNVRHALMGDNDGGPSTVQSWDDGAIQAAKNCNFIKNYGRTPDDEIMIENLSYTGGYASDYSDDYNDITRE